MNRVNASNVGPPKPCPRYFVFPIIKSIAKCFARFSINALSKHLEDQIG